MLSPAEAESAIAGRLGRMPAESLPLSACAGRILRQPLRADRDAPPFDRVTMDGIAIAAQDAGPRREFRVAATAAAGLPRIALPSPADCIEVMTGAVLPAGCDTVVPVEQALLQDGVARLREGCTPEPWRFVHRRGTDARAGDALLEPGVRLGPPEIALAASAGCRRLEVSRLPRIAVLTTGDELVEPGLPIEDHQVRRSNAYGIAAALALAGFPPARDLHLRDDRALLARTIAEALADHDVLVLSGGVSAGRFDHVPGALEEAGVRRVFHHVAQRPGRPLWFGASDAGKAAFALPGNPVSALVCLARYVVPALARLAGAGDPSPPLAVLSQDYRFDAPLACFLPVQVRYDREGRLLAEPRPTGGSGDYVSLAGTVGFVELPRGPALHAAGLAVPFWRW